MLASTALAAHTCMQFAHAAGVPTACGHRRFARNATAEKFLLGAECAGVIAAVGPGVTLKVTRTPAQEQTPLLNRKRAVQTSIFLHGRPPVLTLTMHSRKTHSLSIQAGLRQEGGST